MTLFISTWPITLFISLFHSITAHKCQQCDMAFTQSGDLHKHRRLHFGDNMYHCDVCDKWFRLQKELRHHSFEHYQNKLQENSTEDAVAEDGLPKMG